MAEAPVKRFGRMSVEQYRRQALGDYQATPKTNKYHAQRTEYAGALYDSKGEAREAEKLDWLLKAGRIKGYERQVRIELVPGAPAIGVIVMDFVVDNLDDTKSYLDFKGMETPVFRLKRKLFEHFHAPAKIEIRK